jgi:hypothetical protein
MLKVLFRGHEFPRLVAGGRAAAPARPTGRTAGIFAECLTHSVNPVSAAAVAARFGQATNQVVPGACQVDPPASPACVWRGATRTCGLLGVYGITSREPGTERAVLPTRTLGGRRGT